MPSIVISLVTWNSGKSIKATIESVLKQNYSNFELHILDNDSKDNTCKIIELFNDERIVFQRNSENKGFCGGHNHIINSTDSDLVLLLNPDVILNEDYLSIALETFDVSDNIGIVCGLLLQNNSENPIIDSAGIVFQKDRRFSLRYHNLNINRVKLVTEEVFGSDGALMLLSRKFIDDIKIMGDFFDPMFFAYKEDWDISWRARLLGWKTYFNPNSRAIHPRVFHSNSVDIRKKLPSFIKYHAVKNQFLLLFKNEDIKNFLVDSPLIIYRQILVLVYILLFEKTSLKAYKYFIGNFSKILIKRRLIQKKRKMSSSAIRKLSEKFRKDIEYIS